MLSRRMKISGLFILSVGLFLLGCDNSFNLKDVRIDGAIFATETDAGTFVDITQNGAAMYDLSPTINELPVSNQGGSQRYSISPYALPVDYGREYIFTVTIKDEAIADTVTLPGAFRFNTASDTLTTGLYSDGEVTWTRADSLAKYFAELTFIDNLGRETILRQQETGFRTSYTLPNLDAYGEYRLDVYAYHNGIYDPDRGHLVNYTTPPEWIPSGSLTAWVKHSLYIWVL